MEDWRVGLAGRSVFQCVLQNREPGISGMRTLHRLFKLHLVAEKNEVLRASSHRHSVGQGDLAGFVDEEEIEHVLPFRPGEKPCGARRNANRIGSSRIARAFNVH